jgi:hypothetical protein
LKFGGGLELGLHDQTPTAFGVHKDPLAELTPTEGGPPGPPPEKGSDPLHGIRQYDE